MKLVATEEAIGQVLCHDMTQILPGGTDDAGHELPRYKGPRFKKGHVVTAEDVPVLLSMGKKHLYVFEFEPGMLHENDAARRLAALCLGENTRAQGEPSEGKIGIEAACDGVFLLDSERLVALNCTDEVMVATRKGNFAVSKGDALAGTRVIPLVVQESVLENAERIADVANKGQLMRVAPWKLKTAALVVTGSEVAEGLIEDKFSPVVERKLAGFGVECISKTYPGDDMDALVAAINSARTSGADMVVCTGGMSVDPDDNTPGAIKRAGANIVSYGAPVLPGAMLLVGYFEDGSKRVPVVGLPGCVMYNAATIFDLVLPRIVADVTIDRPFLAALGEGGLCLHCNPCTFPVCPFGK